MLIFLFLYLLFNFILIEAECFGESEQNYSNSHFLTICEVGAYSLLCVACFTLSLYVTLTIYDCLKIPDLDNIDIVNEI